MTLQDIDTADPRKLAEALRAECQSVIDRDALGKTIPGMPVVLPCETVQLAAALLAVVGFTHTDTILPFETPSPWEQGARAAANGCILAACRAYIEAGGKLDVQP